MKIRSFALLTATAALTLAACSKRLAQPVFTVEAIDTLLDGNGFTCNIEYRFASIGNASDSPALEAIERANIGHFFELEEFSGSVGEAAAAAIGQAAAEFAPPAGAAKHMDRKIWEGTISAESEATVVDTLLCYAITRSSYTGGAHGMYGTECHTYSLTGGYELSLADLFSEEQLKRLDQLIRNDIYNRYDARNDEELTSQGFFPEYIQATENFLITAEGITFYYNPYDIGCYALGAVEVSIGREELAAR